MSDHHSHSNNNGISNNWLGFSLSPQMKMELSSSSSSSDHHHHHHNNHNNNHHSLYRNGPTNTNFYLSHSHSLFTDSTTNFHSPLSVMPLKSDGSLCIMEALSRSQPHSQGIIATSSPKLEDFLGGASMGSHDYNQEREAMSLSLDSIYYNNNDNNHNHHHNNENEESSEANREQQSLDLLLQNPFKQQHYYSGIPLHAYAQTEQSSKDMSSIVECSAVDHVVQHLMSGGDLVGGGGGAITCGELQSLTLSMSPGSTQSSCVTAPSGNVNVNGGSEQLLVMAETKKRGPGKLSQKQTVHRKSIDTFGQRTSQFRGVTRHRWTGRYEAHLWDNSCKKEGQTRKGRQVYLGGYDMEEKAARAYDLAALKYWGPSTHINFSLENYQAELEEMKKMTRQEYVAHLRRKSSGFSRGASMYRGVTRHHQHGRWQARIGRVAGNKDLYLGTFSTQEEAAEAYDIAAIKFRGVNAVTNFDITRYDVEKIMASNTLLAGELARRSNTNAVKEIENQLINANAIEHNVAEETNGNGNVNGGHNHEHWKMALYGQPQGSCVDSLDQKPLNAVTTTSSGFLLQDLIGIETVGHVAAGKLGVSNSGGAHFSNTSSLVTSLSSSREGSPDKMGSGNGMIFARPGSNGGGNGSGVGVSSWFPSTAISMGHLPVFAAWNDA